MGNGNIDVGNQTPTRTSGQPAIELMSGRNGCSEQRIDGSSKTEHPCGAMSQQGHEFPGNFSTPQKFVHLVGCRETRRTTTGISPYPHPAKR